MFFNKKKKNAVKYEKKKFIIKLKRIYKVLFSVASIKGGQIKSTTSRQTIGKTTTRQYKIIQARYIVTLIKKKRKENYIVWKKKIESWRSQTCFVAGKDMFLTILYAIYKIIYKLNKMKMFPCVHMSFRWVFCYLN